MTVLIRVVAPHFVAGVIAVDGAIAEAAPILRWSLGWRVADLGRYAKRRGWTVSDG